MARIDFSHSPGENAAADNRRVCRVLVIDDHDAYRETLAEALGDCGYEVAAASSGRDALNTLRDATASRPDLILLDLRMPEMNGWRFREEQLSDPGLASIPAIVVSGALNVEHEAATLQA